MKFHRQCRLIGSHWFVCIWSLCAIDAGLIRAAIVSAPTGNPNVYATLAGQKLTPSRQVVYKQAEGLNLHLDVFDPVGIRKGDKRPAFVTIHGGGFRGGAAVAMYVFAEHYAKLGMVGISVEYRLEERPGKVTIFECVKDARAAVRYVRAHASDFGVDPRKIIVNGASAGAHLAIATALFDGIDDAGSDLSVSCSPNALVMYSPVIDLSPDGYRNAGLGSRWRELSPLQHVRPGMPPTITFQGTADTTTPFVGTKRFHEAMLICGNASQLVVQPGADHAYMVKDPKAYEQTLRQTDRYLEEIGLLTSHLP